VPAEQAGGGRTIGRRVVLASILAGATGFVTGARWKAMDGGPASTTVGKPGTGASAAGARGGPGGAPGGAGSGVGVQAGGVSGAGAAEVPGGRLAVGQWPVGGAGVDWRRLRLDPAYAWSEGGGWAAPFRPFPQGPLAGASVLPRGGRTVFPRFRLMGFCGLPGAPALGQLGIGSLRDRIAELERMAGRYAVDREVLPVLELIACVVQGSPGRDGGYRVRIPAQVIRDHLVAARASGALLLLNVQPGRARFLDEVRVLEPWLREPDVGVALDPEWAVGPGQVPGRVFGSTTGTELDGVAGYLSGVVADGGLPEKVMVVHQLAPPIIRGQEALRVHPGVVVVKSVDGIGTPGAKTDTWRRLVTGMPAVMHPGFKLFFEEDTRGGSRLMTPAQVLALTPTPEYVLYE
jgi:hypothetical protein